MDTSKDQSIVNKRIDAAQNDINRWNTKILETILNGNFWIGIVEFPGDYNGIFIDYTTELDSAPINYLNHHEKLYDIFTDPQYEWHDDIKN